LKDNAKKQLLKSYDTAAKNYAAYQKKLEAEPDFYTKLKDQVQQMQAELDAAEASSA